MSRGHEHRMEMRDEHKHDQARIARLRTLAFELQRLPQSRERDQLLRETHQRTVMVDTGEPELGPRGGSELDPVALFQHMTLPAFRRSR